MDELRTQAATNRLESWEWLEERMTRIADEPLTDDQRAALLAARVAMWHLRDQEETMHGGRSSAAEPDRDVAPGTGHVLKQLGCALPLNDKQMSTIRLRFVPPLVLLKSLNKIRGLVDRMEAESRPPSPDQSLEQKFHVFVNKISRICDFELNGKSFTACVVLKEADGVLYLLASNDRNTRELEDMRVKLMSILSILKGNITANSANKQSDDSLNDCLLRLVLAHHKRRVDCYLTALSKALRDCAEACKRTGKTAENKDILKTLNHLMKASPSNESGGVSSELEELSLNSSSPVTPSEESHAEHIDRVVRLIRVIQNQMYSRAGWLMWQRAAADMQHNATCWSSMQHAAGRLVSYHHVVQTLIIAHHIWAADSDLFLNFDVKCLASSARHPRPLKSKAETAHTIIGRMVRPEQRQNYRDHAREAERFGLDDEIANQWSSDIRPYVHAEILLLDWLQNTPGGTKPYRFFKGWQYIGTSKPTCRLCKYYWDDIAPEVKVRETHANVYYNWRLPDVYQDANGSVTPGEISPKQLKKWMNVVNKIKARVYTDTLRLLELEGRGSDAREHDSNTHTDYIRDGNTISDLQANGGLSQT